MEILKSFSVTQQASYTSTNSSYKMLLWIEIMVHDTTTISSKSGCGLINAESLLGGDATSLHIKTIITDHDITNTWRGGRGGAGGGGNERKCTTNDESLDHSKCRSP